MTMKYSAVKKRSSLKHQLRSQKRLLQKHLNASTETTKSKTKRRTQKARAKFSSNEKEQTNTIQQNIEFLEGRIKKNKQIEREKKNAKKYHMIKFLDRIALSRAEAKVRKQITMEKAKTSTNSTKHKINELYEKLQEIGNDQLHVAYFPNNIKYISLFTAQGKRTILDDAVLKKKLEINTDIQKKYLNDDQVQLKDWITGFDSMQEYERKKKEHKKKKTKLNSTSTNKPDDYLVSENKSNVEFSDKGSGQDDRFQIQGDERFTNLLKQSEPLVEDSDAESRSSSSSLRSGSSKDTSSSNSSSSSNSNSSSSSSSESMQETKPNTKLMRKKESDEESEEDDDFFQSEAITNVQSIFQRSDYNNSLIHDGDYDIEDPSNKTRGKHMGWAMQNRQRRRKR